jgi:hypothetical protein
VYFRGESRKQDLTVRQGRGISHPRVGATREAPKLGATA